METEQRAAEGWYVDPQNPDRWRWWDGEKWTGQYAARQSGKPDKDPRNNNLAAGGMMAGIILPVIGAAVGIALMARGDRRGGSVLIVSVVSFVIWYWLLVVNEAGL